MLLTLKTKEETEDRGIRLSWNQTIRRVSSGKVWRLHKR